MTSASIASTTIRDGSAAIQDDRARGGARLPLEVEQSPQTYNRKDGAAQVCDADERSGRLRYARRCGNPYDLGHCFGRQRVHSLRKLEDEKTTLYEA